MALYRNLGAPLRRTEPFPVQRDGEWVEDYAARRGEVFEPTDDELVRVAYKLQPVGAISSSPAPVRDAASAAPVDAVQEFYKGGGHYEFPDGSKARGAAEAIERYEALTAAEANGGADG